MGDDRSAKIGCTVQTLLEWVKNARALEPLLTQFPPASPTPRRPMKTKFLKPVYSFSAQTQAASAVVAVLVAAARDWLGQRTMSALKCFGFFKQAWSHELSTPVPPAGRQPRELAAAHD